MQQFFEKIKKLQIWVDKRKNLCYYSIVPDMQQFRKIPEMQRKGGNVYKCDDCGEIQEKTAYRPYPEEGGFTKVCRFCGGGYLEKSREMCSLCRKPLFVGDRAYEAGKLLYCTDCIKETEI